MAKGDENVSETGLANLAHAIRRSMAAYIAMNLTPPDSTIEEMLVNADTVAKWIRGKAGKAEEERLAEERPKEPLGIPFDQRDAD